ncbi:hypothetical protein ISCGN_024137 [Ixodes scapularis]
MLKKNKTFLWFLKSCKYVDYKKVAQRTRSILCVQCVILNMAPYRVLWNSRARRRERRWQRTTGVGPLLQNCRSRYRRILSSFERERLDRSKPLRSIPYDTPDHQADLHEDIARAVVYNGVSHKMICQSVYLKL